MRTDERDVHARIQEWDEGAWCLGAVAAVDRPQLSPQLREAAEAVLVAAGVLDAAGAAFRSAVSATREQVSSQAGAPLFQLAGLLAERPATWDEQSDEALIAQGITSGVMARAMSELLLPHLAGAAGRLAQPQARVLDVGTGVGGLAVGFARTFPAATVVGIDVMPRVLGLAEQAVAASGVGDRIELRHQSIAELDDVDAYDLAWVPGPFIPPEPLTEGLRRLACGLRPGGWVLLGHGKFTGEPLEDALNRFKTVAYGGTPLDDEQAQALLRSAGLVDAVSVVTPEGAPAVTAARRAAAVHGA